MTQSFTVSLLGRNDIFSNREQSRHLVISLDNSIVMSTSDYFVFFVRLACTCTLKLVSSDLFNVSGNELHPRCLCSGHHLAIPTWAGGTDQSISFPTYPLIAYVGSNISFIVTNRTGRLVRKISFGALSKMSVWQAYMCGFCFWRDVLESSRNPWRNYSLSRRRIFSPFAFFSIGLPWS